MPDYRTHRRRSHRVGRFNIGQDAGGFFGPTERGVKVKVDVDTGGIDDFADLFFDMAERAEPSQIENAQAKAAADLQQVILSAFGSQAGPNKELWPALAKSTKKRKRTSRKLVETGAMRRSVFARPKGEIIEFGATIPYSGTHQFGTKHVPRRPFMPTDAKGKPLFRAGMAKGWRERWGKILLRFVLRGET